jgi:hypothetical protein
MELFLNFVWLLLTLGSLAICWRAQIRPRTEGGIPRARFFVLVASLLVLLFPTVSVTDDLRELRAVMEDPSLGKRVVKQAESPKYPMLGDGDQPAEPLADLVSISHNNESCGAPARYSPPFREQDATSSISCRAPPVS